MSGCPHNPILICDLCEARSSQALLSVKKQFEVDLLDGDTVEDCGKAMIDAKHTWDWIEKFLVKNGI